MSNNQVHTLRDAVALYREGRLAEAETICAALLRITPRDFDAWHLQGLIAFQAKDFQRAADVIGAALAITPHPLAYNNRGAALLELKQPAQALECFDQALTLKPGFVNALNNRGNALRALWRYAEAVAAYDAALAQRPDYAEAWYNRGLALHEIKDYAEAIKSYRQALAFKPGYADAYNTCGLALKESGDLAAAVESYDKAITLNPALSEAWNNRGIALYDQQKYAEALESYDRAIALAPDTAKAWNNRAAALDYLRRYGEALESYDRAVALDPSFADAWSNRGVTLTDVGRRAEALQSYEKAIAAHPEHADAHWNMSLCFLQLGDFKKGWAGHEWRWKVTSLSLEPRTFPQPLWLGEEPPRDKTILLHADQGFGDALQFARYAKLLHDRGARVLLEVRKALVSLMSGLDGVSQVIAYGEPLPKFDMHCPLGSLPRAFDSDAASIPFSGGYLRGSDERREKWRSILGPRTKPRVGLAWSGNRKHKNDHNRSIALADLAQALPEGFEYIALQKEVSGADQAGLRSGPAIRIFGAELEDFSDTAALCELMDVTVSVDTSVVHLAGALARPVWVLLPFNPDWRWLLERTDSPWYDTARLYRQERAGDWQGVLEKVRADLEKLRA